VNQDRINGFARYTEDYQWIHVDPERAKHSPFGTTIAPGYLTLALAPLLLRQIVVLVFEVTVEVENGVRPACIAELSVLYP
jgi:acyl dehydratase